MGVGCQCSHLTTAQYRSQEPSDGLVCLKCFLVCPPHPLSLVAGYVFHLFQSYVHQHFPFTEQLVLRLVALPPPLATLAPQHVLVVYIISVCCVADLGTC